MRSETPQFDEFVASVISANTAHTAFVTSAAIDHLEAEVKKLAAELELIREGVTLAVSGAWMPTSEHILRMLWPDEWQVAKRIREKEEVER